MSLGLADIIESVVELLLKSKEVGLSTESLTETLRIHRDKKGREGSLLSNEGLRYILRDCMPKEEIGETLPYLRDEIALHVIRILQEEGDALYPSELVVILKERGLSEDDARLTTSRLSESGKIDIGWDQRLRLRK